MRKLLILGLFFSLFTEGLFAQALDYQNPKTYILSGLEVEGAEYSDANAIISISGLSVGDALQVPGSQASDAIERLWRERIFSDVNIRVDNVVSNTIFLTIVVKERPRISQFSFQGISKSQAAFNEVAAP